MSHAVAPVCHLLWPGEHNLLLRRSKIRLLILDVDGVLSDSLIYMGNNGEELKITCVTAMEFAAPSPQALRWRLLPDEKLNC